MTSEPYRTVKEVAGLLKVSEVTVRRWIRDGELRAIDIGKGWRIGPGDLRAFLEVRATQPPAAGRDDAMPDAFGASEGKEQQS